MKAFMRVLFIVVMVCAVYPLSAQEKDAGTGIALFVNAGFGFAYNVYLEDTQNEWVDAYELLLYEEQKGESSVSMIYGGLGIDPRVELGSIVLSLPIEFYNPVKSRRAVSNGVNTVESEIDVSFWSLSLVANYKIDTGASGYLLLGGGAGLYYGSIEWNVIINDTGDIDKDSAWTMGWQTGLEYHWVLGSVDLYLAATSRFAEVITFKVHSDDGENNMIAGVTGLYLSAGAGYRF